MSFASFLSDIWASISVSLFLRDAIFLFDRFNLFFKFLICWLDRLVDNLSLKIVGKSCKGIIRQQYILWCAQYVLSWIIRYYVEIPVCRNVCWAPCVLRHMYTSDGVVIRIPYMVKACKRIAAPNKRIAASNKRIAAPIWLIGICNAKYFQKLEKMQSLAA